MRRFALAASFCVVLSAQAGAQEPAGRGWQLVREVDPITDQVSVVVALEANAVAGARGRPTGLGIACVGRNPRVAVVWPMGVKRSGTSGEENGYLTWRFDSKTPRTGPWRVLSRDVTISLDPKGMLAEALDAERLVVRVATSFDDEITATFVLAGLREAMEPVRAACDWTIYPPPPAQSLPPVVSPRAPAGPPDTSVTGTLERLRALQAQQSPAQTRGSGPTGQSARSRAETTERLTAGEIRGVADTIGRCFAMDVTAPGSMGVVVELRVEADATGVVRVVRPAGSIPSEPVARAVFEAARRALMDPKCSPLPFPRDKLEAINAATFRFTPRGLAH
jgi:hypothetical protein